MHSKYQIQKILENSLRNMNCFSWIKLVLVLIHLKYRYYNSPTETFPTSLTISVKFYLSQLKPFPTQTSSCSSSVSIFCPTPFDHEPPQVFDIPNDIWCQTNQICYQAIYKSWYLIVKHTTHQKAESLRAASPSNLDNMVSNTSNFNAKYAIFSTKWQVLLHFHNPSALQSPLTLYSYITQQVFTSLFLRTTIPTIHTKNILPTSNILPIQAVSREQGAREYCEG